MAKNAICDLQACWDGTIIVGVAYKEFVCVWDTISLKKKCEFRSTMDYGGRRFAVARNNRTILIGAYHRYGVAGYEAVSGSELWRRKDIKRVQNLYTSYDQPFAFACFSDQSALAINIIDGTTISKKPMVKAFFDGPFGQVKLVDMNRRKYELFSGDGARISNIKVEGCRLLATSFTPTCFAIADHGCFVRGFSTDTGRELWRHVPVYGNHVVALSYHPEDEVFFGVEAPYALNNETAIIRLDTRTGECHSRKSLPGARAFAFVNRASKLISADGSVFEARSGTRIHKLAHPEFDT